MGTAKKVEVVIGGEIITLISAESEEYIQRLARYIDKKFVEIKSLNANASVNERTRTIFFAVNLADDYFKTLEDLRRLEEEHDKFIAEMGRMQEENLLLNEKLRELQVQLNEKNRVIEQHLSAQDHPSEPPQYSNVTQRSHHSHQSRDKKNNAHSRDGQRKRLQVIS